MSKKKQLTTGAEQPVGYNQNALTAGSRGPILLQDYQLLEKMGKKTFKCGLDTPLKVHSGLLDQRRYECVRLLDS